MRVMKSFSLVIIVAILAVLSGSLFVVKEGQQGIVLQLGKMKLGSDDQVIVYQPGLHFKMPFINSSRIFDTRIQGFTSGQFSTLTSKQTFLEVEYYAKWRISDVPLYYKRTAGSPARAETLMEPKINDILRAQFGKHSSDDIISSERATIMEDVLKDANGKIEQDYGIHLIDVRLDKVQLPTQVMKSVFNRMASERKQFANNKRAEGLKVAEAVKAKADQKVVVIKAQANEQAATIKAQGDQLAATTYASAYGSDPKFYALYRSLEAYKTSFADDNNIMVLSPDSQFFDYFNQSQAQKASSK